MPDRMNLKNLPPRDAPDYFRLLVRNCIETYKELPNDGACLNYNKVSGKLRALVLDDEEYKQETRNIYAKRQLEELRDLDDIGKLALDGGGETDGEDAFRGTGKKKKSVSADKDALVMRFKAAQMRRELIAAMNEDGSASERDAANFMYVPINEAEFKNVRTDEIYDGDADGALDELTDRKEKAPEGTSGKVQNRGRVRPPDDEDFFEILPDGGIVEK